MKKKRQDVELLLIGAQMANVMFNLSQRGDGVSNIHLAANEYGCFKELQTQWDAAIKKYRQSPKRLRTGGGES